MIEGARRDEVFDIEAFNKLSRQEQHIKAGGLKRGALDKGLNTDEHFAVSTDESRVDNIYRSITKGDYFKLDQERMNRMNIYLEEISTSLTRLLLLEQGGEHGVCEEEVDDIVKNICRLESVK